MSRKSIHISIPTPCNESWGGMDMTERGAFCNSCQKEVIDFSAMTDREVINYLAMHQTGCGKFRNDQLNTHLTIPRVHNGFMKWKALLLGLLPFFSMRVAHAAASKNENLQILQESKNTAVDEEDKQIITGRVVSDSGNAIYGAVLEIIDSAGEYIGPRTATDSMGYFCIKPDKYLLSPRLRVFKMGYQPEIQFLNDQDVQEYIICLSPMEIKTKYEISPVISKGYTIGCISIESKPLQTEQNFNFRPLDFDFEYGQPYRERTRFGRKDY